jgi:hypothetical protein
MMCIGEGVSVNVEFKQLCAIPTNNSKAQLHVGIAVGLSAVTAL